MKTDFDKYISDQIQNIEENLQVGNWGKFQKHYARHRRVKMVRFIIPAVAAASAILFLLLSGINNIDNGPIRMRNNYPLIAENTPTIQVDIPTLRKDFKPLRERKNHEPTQSDNFHIADSKPQIDTVTLIREKSEPEKLEHTTKQDTTYQSIPSYDYFETNNATAYIPKQSVPKLSIGVSGGQGLAGYDQVDLPFGAFQYRTSYAEENPRGGISHEKPRDSILMDKPVDNLVAGKIEEVSYKHRPPITFGISLGINFTQRLALITGLDYSLYLSEILISYSDKKSSEMQQLHYLGLPLRLNYTIYSKNSFEWYAGGGFKVDKCIYAKSGATVLKESDFLLSALLTTGIQYKITRNLSIYCEPYCSYLFSDTRLPSYRSENPLEISAKLGIRVNL
jgi:hypothetical protein